MTVIGCTGHQGLTPLTERLVASSVVDVISRTDGEEITGLTSLAEGADQLFAFAVLACGGDIDTVIPCEGYETAFPSEESRAKYSKLIDLSGNVTTLQYDHPSEDAFLAAGRRIVENCDLLVAIWNGQDAVGKGGTADIVGYAKELGTPVRIVWPAGSRRKNENP
jgi:hypothetical protein